MRAAVRYQSRSGNTKKLAEAIADAVGAEALQLSSDIKPPTDILFIGGGVYAGGLEKSFAAFLNGLDAGAVDKVVIFSTSAKGESIRPLVEQALPEGIPIAGELHCPGRFLLMNRKRPNDEDLAAAAKFAQKMVSLEAAVFTEHQR